MMAEKLCWGQLRQSAPTTATVMFSDREFCFAMPADFSVDPWVSGLVLKIHPREHGGGAEVSMYMQAYVNVYVYVCV